MTPPRNPLIVILGTTGVGKSQLGIELALSLPQKARILNADAMQTYKGLNLATNKVTAEEMKGVPHRLMDFKDPKDGEGYFVTQWVRDAITEIEECHRAGEVPIVVGGTTYWIQHLVFANRLVSGGGAPAPVDHEDDTKKLAEALNSAQRELFSHLPSKADADSLDESQAFALHSLLRALDPDMAARWHWKDTRKVLRNIEIVKDTGRRASDVLMEQSLNAGVARYPTLMFWLYARPEVLNPRLEARVDLMVENGLLKEIQEMRAFAVGPGLSEDKPLDYTTGIFQTIGFKEFDRYLGGETSPDVFSEAVAQMKLATKQYAQRQVRWIRNKLLPAVNDQDPGGSRASILVLDATNLAQWPQNVAAVAQTLVSDFLSGHSVPDPVTTSPIAREMLDRTGETNDVRSIILKRRRVICEACTADPERPVMIEEGEEWKVHIRSKAHRSRAGKEARIAAQMDMAEQKRKERALLRDVPQSDPSI